MNDCRHCQTHPASFYDRLFARFYDPFMAEFEEKILLPKREKLLAGLMGKILEVGSGTGVNFPLYGPEAEVLAIEPSAAMLQHAQRRKETSPARIELLQAGIEEAHLKDRVPPGGYDAIVCTLVLCTAPDPEATIDRLRGWLRPGGELIVLEHIRASDGWQPWLHWLINPIWRYFGQGCNLTRPTDLYLKQAGFSVVWENYFHTGLDFYEARLRV